MNSKKPKVLIGLSGGVDSAVASLLLKKQGYEVIGAFMKCFSANSPNSKHSLSIIGDCNSATDKKDAQKIAALLDIPLITLNFEKEYRSSVINPMFKDYARGLTPNPDSLCNKIIKFPLLWKEAKKLKCDYIATGHYIKKVKTPHSIKLQIPKDKNKDQSYFLYDLNQKDLSHTLFPIGDANLTKEQVRKIAKKHKLSNHDKRSTRGLCFIGKINMKSFLKQKIKIKPGKILDIKGNIIGTHQGVMFYTIGERIGPRSGFDIDKEYTNKVSTRLYIASKNIRTNIITVAPRNHKKLFSNKFNIIKINWINEKPKFPLDCKVRIRHFGDLIPTKITSKTSKLHCTLKKPIKGLAEGQSCVIYKGKDILGGGEIRFK